MYTHICCADKMNQLKWHLFKLFARQTECRSTVAFIQFQGDLFYVILKHHLLLYGSDLCSLCNYPWFLWFQRLRKEKYLNKDGSEKIYNQHEILSPSVSSECKKIIHHNHNILFRFQRFNERKCVHNGWLQLFIREIRIKIYAGFACRNGFTGNTKHHITP